MVSYAEELAARLPRVAPDLSFATVRRTDALSVAEQLRAPRALSAVAPRIVHHLAVYAPVFAPGPTVVTVHDLIHVRFPDLFKRTVGPYYATVVRAVCARASRVITDDPRTVSDLERYLGVPPRKVDVIALGVDDAYREPVAVSAGTRPYFLNVGNHRPHKNLKTLFAAWSSLPQDVAVDLVLTGQRDLDASDVPTRPNGDVRFVGEVSTAELRALYRGAVALVHPALCEGFGLPMLEAATVGTAVIASTDAVPAVLRPYCAVFETLDVASLRDRLIGALRDPTPLDAARSFARTLTWDRCARQTAEVYRTVLQETSPR